MCRVQLQVDERKAERVDIGRRTGRSSRWQRVLEPISKAEGQSGQKWIITH